MVQSPCPQPPSSPVQVMDAITSNIAIAIFPTPIPIVVESVRVEWTLWGRPQPHVVIHVRRRVAVENGLLILMTLQFHTLLILIAPEIPEAKTPPAFAVTSLERFWVPCWRSHRNQRAVCSKTWSSRKTWLAGFSI